MSAAVDPLPAADNNSDLTEKERVQRQKAKNQKLIALLDSWINVSEEEIKEQVETWAFLQKALDEDRPGYRKLFP